MTKVEQKIPEGWSVKKLGEVCSLYSGGTPSKSVDSYWRNGNIKWLSAKYIEDDRVIGWDLITENALNNSSCKLAKIGDIVLVSRVSVGKMFICKESFAVNQDLTIIKSKNSCSNFLFYALKDKTAELIDKSQGLAIKGITKNEISNIFIKVPPLSEQERIAEILGTWDEGIEKLSALIGWKEKQKKSLMHRLIYNRKNAEVYIVDELFMLGRGRVISKKEISENKGLYPVYSSQTSNNGEMGKINSFDFEGEFITWTTDGANAGRVFYRKGKFNCTNVCGTAKLKKTNKANLYYVMCYLNNVTKYFVSYVGNPKLMNGVFSQIPILLPKKELQDKIAEVLSTADDEINLLKQKLAALKEQKKGLMQQLLTGKVRVKVN